MNTHTQMHVRTYIDITTLRLCVYFCVCACDILTVHATRIVGLKYNVTIFPMHNIFSFSLKM